MSLKDKCKKTTPQPPPLTKKRKEKVLIDSMSSSYIAHAWIQQSGNLLPLQFSDFPTYYLQ